MPLSVHQFPCLRDNYGFLIRDEAAGVVASIDAPDADEILKQARGLGWNIDVVLNTHWHADHMGGDAAIVAATGARVVAPAEVARRGQVDRVVSPGETVSVGETMLEVLDVGGHTLGHIAYHSPADAMAFVGDALFPMGCGRLFEGEAEQMWASLQRIAALPEATAIYCAHEYAAANARFALSVDDDAAVADRARQVFARRARGEPTVPTTVAAERATNPFLRAPLLRPHLAPVEAFAELRRLKDGFKG
jgi:hydroxyacylglutathione hydrolase